MLGSDSQRVKLACHLLRTLARLGGGTPLRCWSVAHMAEHRVTLGGQRALQGKRRRECCSHSSTSSGAICPSRQASYTSINAQIWIKSTRLCGNSHELSRARRIAMGRGQLGGCASSAPCRPVLLRRAAPPDLQLLAIAVSDSLSQVEALERPPQHRVVAGAGGDCVWRGDQQRSAAAASQPQQLVLGSGSNAHASGTHTQATTSCTGQRRTHGHFDQRRNDKHPFTARVGARVRMAAKRGHPPGLRPCRRCC